MYAQADNGNNTEAGSQRFPKLGTRTQQQYSSVMPCGDQLAFLPGGFAFTLRRTFSKTHAHLLGGALCPGWRRLVTRQSTRTVQVVKLIAYVLVGCAFEAWLA